MSNPDSQEIREELLSGITELTDLLHKSVLTVRTVGSVGMREIYRKGDHTNLRSIQVMLAWAIDQKEMPMATHVHETSEQGFMLIDGTAIVYYNDNCEELAKPFDSFTIEKNMPHSVHPGKVMRMLVLNKPSIKEYENGFPSTIYM